MKLIKKMQKKEDKKIQPSRSSKDKGSNESDFLEPFAWKAFFEEAQKMGMKVDTYSLIRTNFKIPPTPAVVSETAMFGVSLDDIMERQKKKYPDTSVPNIAEQCIQYIHKYGLKEIEVFQSSSIDCEKVKKNRDSIDAGNGVDVQLHEHLKYIDVHTVAGLLKQYLRELPQPIIPSDVFDMLLTNYNRGSEEVRKAIHLLPRNSYNLLDKVFFLLSEICRHENYNDCDAATLAETFGPVLMWRNTLSAGIDISKNREIASSFIINYSSIFSKGTTSARPALGGSFFQPSGLSKSASLSTLSFHTPSSPSTPSPPTSRSSPLSHTSTLSHPSSRTSSEAPQANYMLELYRNMQEGDSEDAEGSEEEEGEDGEEGEEEVRRGYVVPAIPTYPSAPALTRSREIISEDRGGEEEENRSNKGKMPVEWDRKDKGKMSGIGGGGGMGMRKSVSENLANKYTNGTQKKGGFGLFLKKIELRKKT